MALTPQNNDAFFREVDDELRREQIGSFWRNYGRFIAIAVIAGLALFGGWLWWQHQQNSVADAASEQFTQALIEVGQGEPAATAANAKLDKLAAEGNPAYRASALLTKAAAAQQKGDAKAAAAAYQAVASDTKLAQPYRDLATVRQVAAEFDTLQPAQVIERLKPLAVAGNPWFGSAGEMTAIAYMRMNKPDLAAPLFAAMAKDEGVPPSIRDRAGRMAATLGVDAAVATPGPAKE
ncbi:tetratricopeptide repeat protein [Sphingomonas sp. KC8]|uniref:tetratricopeptide repeat protein n=1 Tax=Sphingomonas sp. KC8 TaxID=1030157 RepID=UPI000248865C|nr:tetratricopeptide repeat protein [Sphingomonas sp. KC8]ARS27938.1 hypothetical protein KC8_11655 [Sphingomonas sp. KC8]